MPAEACKAIRLSKSFQQVTICPLVQIITRALHIHLYVIEKSEMWNHAFSLWRQQSGTVMMYPIRPTPLYGSHVVHPHQAFIDKHTLPWMKCFRTIFILFLDLVPKIAIFQKLKVLSARGYMSHTLVLKHLPCTKWSMYTQLGSFGVWVYPGACMPIWVWGSPRGMHW